PSEGGLLGSIFAAFIWIPYFQESRRVKATFIVGGTFSSDAAWLFTKLRASSLNLLGQTTLAEEGSNQVFQGLCRFQGIWLSKRALLIGGCCIALLAGLTVVWANRKAATKPEKTGSREALTHIEQGNAWLKKLEDDIALKEFDEAIRLDPNS